MFSGSLPLPRRPRSLMKKGNTLTRITPARSTNPLDRAGQLLTIDQGRALIKECLEEIGNPKGKVEELLRCL